MTKSFTSIIISLVLISCTGKKSQFHLPEISSKKNIDHGKPRHRARLQHDKDIKLLCQDNDIYIWAGKKASTQRILDLIKQKAEYGHVVFYFIVKYENDSIVKLLFRVPFGIDNKDAAPGYGGGNLYHIMCQDFRKVEIDIPSQDVALFKSNKALTESQSPLDVYIIKFEGDPEWQTTINLVNFVANKGGIYAFRNSSKE